MKPVLLDGAVGTSLWAKAEAHGYKKDPVWKYNIEHPEIVAELAQEYAAAGSKMILANTFGANGPMVKRVSSYSTADVVSKGVQITRKALEGTDCVTALSMGPLTALLDPYGDMEEEECAEIYEEIAEAGVNAGAQAFMIQTFMDLHMMEVAAKVCVKYKLPIYCTLTFEKRGKTMMGNSVEDMIETLEPLGVAGMGMNCSLGPDLALPIIKEFAEKTSVPLVYKPNAGMPISSGGSGSAITAEEFAKAVEPALDFVSYIGGCCGSDPTYVAEIKKLLDKR